MTSSSDIEYQLTSLDITNLLITIYAKMACL